MGNLLSFWTPTLCTEMERHRQVLISNLRDVKYLAKFAREQFNFDELEVTLDTKIKDMRIIYEIIDNYLYHKPVQIQFTQTQQQSHVPSRSAPNLPPRTAFQSSPSPPNVKNQQFATGNTPNPNFAKKQAYQPDFTKSTPGPTQTGGNSVPNFQKFQNFQSLPPQFQQYQQYPQYPKPTLNDAKQLIPEKSNLNRIKILEKTLPILFLLRKSAICPSSIAILHFSQSC